MTEELQRRIEEQLSAFALDCFRPGQEEVIRTILGGQDCLCIMPTGGGKSLCYQLPAVLQDGVTLVVSPLIALMKDQVDSMRELGMNATLINSTLDVGEQQRRIGDMARGRYDLIYIAPERLRSPRFLEAVAQSSVKMLAIDEAHCISQWGHDFRPDYARLGQLRCQLGMPPTIALTATATPAVRADIVAQLQLHEPRVFITGFARPNLHFEVQQAWSHAAKVELLESFLAETAGAGIVYTSTRRRCDELAELLQLSTGRQTGVYHAGLPMPRRREVQEAFMRDELQIVVATNAFGMGIDKADLRFVVHFNIPGSLEAYYQEAGRAGRDGLPARCLLLYSPGDRSIQEFFIENAYPSRDTVARVYRYLCELDEDPIEITQQDLKERLSLAIGGEGIGACEQLLEKCGAIERLSTQENRASIRLDAQPPSLVDYLPREATAQRRVMHAIEQRVGQRRGDRVYFPLNDLIGQCGMKRSAVTRALRELRQLDAFDYVPPFRGRAVHVPRRERPFRDLPIDFAALDRRRATEVEKLERMIQYATAGSCRQLVFLQYFGDPSADRCGICDNCGGPLRLVAEQDPVDDRDERLLQCVRAALSGVARAQGRVGKRMVAKMLCGSRSRQVGQLHLDRLSTFGLLAQLKQTEATELLEALIRANLVRQTETHRLRPVVQLTPQGRQVMIGQTGLARPLSIAQSLKRRLSSVELPQAPRTPASEAKRAGAAPSLASCPEVAVVPARSLGQEPPNASDVSNASNASNASDVSDVSGSRPDWYWTWKVFSAGCSLEECQRIRRLDYGAILDHLGDAAEAGHAISLSWIWSRNEQEELAALDERPDEPSRCQWARRLDPRHLRIWRHGRQARES